MIVLFPAIFPNGTWLHFGFRGILCQVYFFKLFQPCSQNAGFSVHVLGIQKVKEHW